MVCKEHAQILVNEMISSLKNMGIQELGSSEDVFLKFVKNLSSNRAIDDNPNEDKKTLIMNLVDQLVMFTSAIEDEEEENSSKLQKEFKDILESIDKEEASVANAFVLFYLMSELKSSSFEDLNEKLKEVYNGSEEAEHLLDSIMSDEVDLEDKYGYVKAILLNPRWVSSEKLDKLFISSISEKHKSDATFA